MPAAKHIPAKGTPRRYVSVSFRVPASSADDAAGLIVAAGALGCAVVAPFQPYLRSTPTVELEAYFASLKKADLLNIRRTLKAAGMLANAPSNPECRVLKDPGWATMWMDRFTPVRIGRRLEIAPPWDDKAGGGRLRIVIKPGQAFGTGHHGTTRGVLRTIERLTASRRFRSALDVGTGSGILALAMLKLGVGKVCAIDVDPIALENARENARLNQIADDVEFSAQPLSTLRKQFDLVTANIISSTLIEIATRLISRMKRGGILILSGILRREMAAVGKIYAPHLRPVSSTVDRGWATMVFQK